MPFEASGNHGEVLVGGYQHSADLLNWEIRRREEVLADNITLLEAKLENIDRFWITYQRVSIRLRMNRCWWIWDQAEIQSTDPLLVFMYGSPRSLPLE